MDISPVPSLKGVLEALGIGKQTWELLGTEPSGVQNGQEPAQQGKKPHLSEISLNAQQVPNASTQAAETSLRCPGSDYQHTTWV